MQLCLLCRLELLKMLLLCLQILFLWLFIKICNVFSETVPILSLFFCFSCNWDASRNFPQNDSAFFFLTFRFDLHDTEDCPTQSMQHPDEEEVSSPDKSGGGHTKSGGTRGAQRSYCDNCEVFGHDTSDCVVAESY
jgi:CAP-Gly domain-containing linker protein 1